MSSRVARTTPAKQRHNAAVTVILGPWCLLSIDGGYVTSGRILALVIVSCNAYNETIVAENGGPAEVEWAENDGNRSVVGEFIMSRHLLSSLTGCPK